MKTMLSSHCIETFNSIMSHTSVLFEITPVSCLLLFVKDAIVDHWEGGAGWRRGAVTVRRRACNGPSVSVRMPAGPTAD
jgi:hypothetical protein